MKPDKKQLLKARPSPAMIVAMLALIVALGGTSYAATKLARNSVGPAQIKRNAVTTPKLRANSVTAIKIRPNSITTSKVMDRSLTARDFQMNSLPRGPQGATGPAGPIEGTPAGGDLSGTYPNPTFASFPAARAKSSTPQVIVTSKSPAPNTPVPLELDSEQFDIGDMYLAPDDQLMVKKRGTYQITAQMGWTGNTTGQRQLRIMAGGSLVALDQAAPGTDGNIRQTANSLSRLAPGDAISLVAFQNSDVDLSTAVNAGQIGGAWLSAVWVGP